MQGPTQPAISLTPRAAPNTLPTMLRDDQYVFARYWKPEAGCMWVRYLRASPVSRSQSIRLFMISQGRVRPGRIMPLNHDMASAERSSKGFSSMSLSSNTYSISSMLGHLRVAAKSRRASRCRLLLFKSKLKVLCVDEVRVFVISIFSSHRCATAKSHAMTGSSCEISFRLYLSLWLLEWMRW
jgi:hypothetical protein